MSARRISPIAIAFVLIAPRLVGCDKDFHNIDEGAALCNEAMSHLVDCCPGFDPTPHITCDSHDVYDCNGNKDGHIDAEIGEEQSRCIIDADCSAAAPLCAAILASPGGRPSLPGCD